MKALLYRWLKRLALGVGLMGAAANASARSDVPAHWVSYAQLVSNQLQVWLSDDDVPAARRLHDWLEIQASEEGRAPGSVVVRIWIAESGQVEKLEATSLGDPVIDDSLCAVLTGQPLAEPPPKDMRQPLILRLVLNSPAPG